MYHVWNCGPPSLGNIFVTSACPAKYVIQFTACTKERKKINTVSQREETMGTNYKESKKEAVTSDFGMFLMDRNHCHCKKSEFPLQ